MARHQYGIFAEGTTSHHHLEFVLHDGLDHDAVAQALEGVRAANAEHRTNGGTNLVIGFGPALWALLPEAVPADPVTVFPGYDNDAAGLHAPSTQHDLWVWVHGPTRDLVIDVVRTVTAALAPVADLVVDVTGFVYHDSRDLTGFIDGTANPYLDDAPVAAAVPAGEPGAGGVYAMTMNFVHDLDAFEVLEVHDQELVFGRTKADGRELAPDVKPPDSHIGRAEVDDADGNELQVYRRSVPVASASEQGLFFVSFGADTARFDLQLRTMYGLEEDGLTDRLLRFSTPTTGSFWFCPSVEGLDRAAPLPDDD